MSTFDLETWAAKFRFSPLPKAMKPGDLVILTDMETTVFLVERAGNFVVETSSRGGARRFIASFTDRDDAVRLIIYWIGASLSSQPADGTGFAGATLDESPISTHLSWSGGSAEFGPGRGGTMWAERFNWARDKSLEQVAAAF